MDLKKIFGGLMEGASGELGQPDLLRKVTEGITKLARHADRGLPILPREVEVHIKVGHGSLQTIEQFQPEYLTQSDAIIIQWRRMAGQARGIGEA